MILRILAVGDVVGAPGLAFLSEHLRAFKEQEHIDFTVVNGENANVVGVTPKQADAIFAAGADVITLGNHTWMRYELQPYLEQKKRILRPANFAPQCPGRGWGEYSVRGGPICVINLMGRSRSTRTRITRFSSWTIFSSRRRRRSSSSICTPRPRAKSAPWAFISTGA